MSAMISTPENISKRNLTASLQSRLSCGLTESILNMEKTEPSELTAQLLLVSRPSGNPTKSKSVWSADIRVTSTLSPPGWIISTSATSDALISTIVVSAQSRASVKTSNS